MLTHFDMHILKITSIKIRIYYVSTHVFKYMSNIKYMRCLILILIKKITTKIRSK